MMLNRPLNRPYSAEDTGICFYCNKLTYQYYMKCERWICDKCLSELEEDEEKLDIIFGD